MTEKKALYNNEILPVSTATSEIDNIVIDKIVITTEKLENIKNKIESMNKNHQIEILKILKKNPNVKINENKSGVFINLSFLPITILQEIEFYLNYVHDQENSLLELESQKKEFKDTFFMENCD